MSRRFTMLMMPVAAIFVVAGCAGPPMISREDVAALCSATGAAMSAVDDAMLEASNGEAEWTSAIDAVGVVVDEARETGYPGAVELAEDWQASVVAASQADDRGPAFSLLIESEGNSGLLFMCDRAEASVPGVEPVATDDIPLAFLGGQVPRPGRRSEQWRLRQQSSGGDDRHLPCFVAHSKASW